MHVSLRMWPWLWHRCGKGCCVGRAGQNSMWLGVHRYVSLWHFLGIHISNKYHPMRVHGTTSLPSTKGLQEMQMQQAAERTSWMRQYLYVFFLQSTKGLTKPTVWNGSFNPTLLNLNQAWSQGLNCRKYHSFHSEDFIGRIKRCCAVSSQISLEPIALQRWYTGFLKLSLTYFFI